MGAPKPSPNGDQNTGYVLITVATATFVPALLAVCLRMYARARVVRALGWDDWIMIPAIISAFIASAIEIVGAKRGIGRHEFYLTPHQRAEAGKYSVLSIVFCITALSIGKISMCISLIRILDGTNRRILRWSLCFLIFLQFAVNVVVCTTIFVQCDPVRKTWTPELRGQCWKPTVQQDLNYFQVAVSALSDWLLAGLPIYIIRELNMSKHNKIMLSILMGFGMITGVFAIIRGVYLEPYAKTDDPSWTNVGLLVWGGVERNTAIIVACIPFIRPILRTPWFKSMVTYVSPSRDKSKYPSREGYTEHGDQSYELSEIVKSTKSSAFGINDASKTVSTIPDIERDEYGSTKNFVINN